MIFNWLEMEKIHQQMVDEILNRPDFPINGVMHGYRRFGNKAALVNMETNIAIALDDATCLEFDFPVGEPHKSPEIKS
jgi:hypothetical protein